MILEKRSWHCLAPSQNGTVIKREFIISLRNQVENSRKALEALGSWNSLALGKNGTLIKEELITIVRN